MPSTLPTSSWTGRTAESSTSTTRLDFSSPMPSAICDPYTLISTHTMTTVNSPVSRDESDVDGASRPRTGSVTPCATAARRARHGLDQLGQPGELGQRRRPNRTRRPAAPASTMISEPGTSTALRSPLRSAASAAARLGSGTATACPPDSRPASVTMPLIAVVPPTTPIRSGLLLGRTGSPGSATARATAISRMRGGDHEDPGLGPQPDLPAGHQPGHCSAAASGLAAVHLGGQRPVLIAPLPSSPVALLVRVLGLGLADRRAGRLAEHLGQRPVLEGEVLDRAGRPGEIQDRAGSRPHVVREISAVPSAPYRVHRAAAAAGSRRGPGTGRGRPPPGPRAWRGRRGAGPRPRRTPRAGRGR